MLESEEDCFSRTDGYSLAIAALDASWLCWKGTWLADVQVVYQKPQILFYKTSSYTGDPQPVSLLSH